MKRKFNQYDPTTFRLFKKTAFRKVAVGDRVQVLGSELWSRLKSFRKGALLTKPMAKWTNIDREFLVSEYVQYNSINMYSDTGDAGDLLGFSCRLNRYLTDGNDPELVHLMM
jgi:hypothetical protein